MKIIFLSLLMVLSLKIEAQSAAGTLVKVSSNKPEITKKTQEVLECQLPKNKLYQTEKEQLYLLIENQVHHLRGLLKPWNNDPSMKLITESKNWEHYIRPNTTFAADLAFVWRFGNFDEKVVGTSREKLLQEELIPMLRYLIRTHNTGDLKTSDGKSWGDAWQSAHWASALGNAAWWTWKKLPAEIQQGAQRVVAHEADRIAQTIPPHQVNFDSKSEENAWNSQILSAAIVLMPNDSRCVKWEVALQKWSMSSYLRASDENNQTIVDGETVAKQFTGANIFDDFSLENHGFVHPDYMGAWTLNAGNDLDYLMSNRKPFASALFNLPEIYNLQKRFLLPDGGYCYPSGQDWAIFRNADWMPSHATAVARFNDTEALYHLHNAIETAQKMQQRNADGAIYIPGENYFASSQPHLGYWLTQAWLVLHFAKKEVRQTIPQPGVNYLTDGKIIMRRDDKAIQTVSWGLVQMIQMMPVAKDHIISPDQRNGIGRVYVENDSIVPIVLKSMEVKPNSNGFFAKMVVYHGDLVQAEITCEAKADGSMTINEVLSALRKCSTNRIETLSFGVLNNPNWVYETGKRNLKIGQEFFAVKSGADFSYAAKAAAAAVDVMDFKLDAPGIISYRVAKKMENSRFTDMLVLNTIATKRNWNQNEIISKKQLTISIQKK